MIRDLLPYLLTGSGGILAGIAALMGVQRSRRAGVAGDEREARRDEAAQRRDTIADRDALIDRLVEQVQSLSARVDALEDKRREDATLIRGQDDHIDALEAHIWAGKPPPPPPRPSGL